MVKLIVAIAKNRAIGKDNDLIWHLPADMKFFSDATKENIVLMGRKNWDSIPLKYRPLPKRLNIVITRNPDFNDDGCEVFNSIEKALNAYAEDERDLFIIGGGQIYEYCLNESLVDEMLITHIEEDFLADTFFPAIDENDWEISEVLTYARDNKNPYDFVVKRYIKAVDI